MMRICAVVVCSIVLVQASVTSADVIVSSIAAPGTVGKWSAFDIRGGGTASIVNLSGLGGNLENNAPLPTHAALITTGFSNNDKAEIGIGMDFGAVQDLSSLGYSYHKATVAGGNASAAPAIKLTILGPHPTDGFVTLVYEPTWNQPGNIGSSVVVPTDEWLTAAIDPNNGVFWTTGGFGLPSAPGGPSQGTLAELIGLADPEFATARVIGISVGVGTFNQGQQGYFDNVSASFTSGFEATYDFERVPEPASIAIWSLLGLGCCAYAYRRRRKANQSV